MTLTDVKQIEEYLKIKKIYGMIRIYIDQSQKAYSELYLFLQSDIKTTCLEDLILPVGRTSTRTVPLVKFYGGSRYSC